MRIKKTGKTTNKEFKGSFVELASNKTKKGHLTNQSRDVSDNQVAEGVLKYIVIDRIDTDGWMVEVGSGKDTFVYACTNPQWALSIPDSTETDTMYVPKNKTEVEFSMDKHAKIYTILRVKGASQSFSNYQDKLKISIDENSKTNKDVNARIEMTATAITLGAESVKVYTKDKELDLVEEQVNHDNKIIRLEQENAQLWERIENIENQLTQNENEEGED